jgi:2-amino-4-hydroxy-6-hydroxymethyldihydropteridine diphosphokinase
LKEKGNSGLNRSLIGLGSNLNPEENIKEALSLLGDLVAIRKISAVYQSPAVGSTGPDYLNSAALIETDLPLELLQKNVLSSIENQLKRVRSSNKYMDRTIDLDVLIFNQTVLDPELWTQAHVAVPAADIFPNYSNPETGEKISQAAERLLPGTNLRLRSDLA